jgi:hypothetical protein
MVVVKLRLRWHLLLYERLGRAWRPGETFLSWPRSRYTGPGGGLYAGPGGGLYTGPGGGAYSGPGGGLYSGPGGGLYSGPGGALYTGPGGGLYTGPGGALYTGPGGGFYTGPGGFLYTGPGGGAYSGPGHPWPMNWPPLSWLIVELDRRRLQRYGDMLRKHLGKAERDLYERLGRR